MELRAQKWEIRKERVMQRHTLERMIRASSIIYPALLEGLKSTTSMMECQTASLSNDDDDQDVDLPMMNEEHGLVMEEEIHDDIPISFASRSIPREELKIIEDGINLKIDHNDRNVNILSPEPIESPMKKKLDEKRKDDEMHRSHRSGARAKTEKKRCSSSQVYVDIVPKKRASRGKTKSLDIRPKTKPNLKTIRDELDKQQQSSSDQSSPEALRRSSRQSVSPVRLVLQGAPAVTTTSTPEGQKNQLGQKKQRSPSPLIPLPMATRLSSSSSSSSSMLMTMIPAKGRGPKRRKPTTATASHSAPLSSSAFSNFVNHHVAMIPALKPHAKQNPSKRK